MGCPNCNNHDSKVLESRDVENGSSIRRRRQCLACGFRFTTYERVETPSLMVVKRNGDRELFSREKLSRGIYRAFEKRPVPAEVIESLISDIEREVKTTGESEVASVHIGELLMDRLINIDDVAYVRFASVYRSFTDIKSFEAELARLKKRQPLSSGEFDKN